MKKKIEKIGEFKPATKGNIGSRVECMGHGSSTAVREDGGHILCLNNQLSQQSHVLLVSSNTEV